MSRILSDLFSIYTLGFVSIPLVLWGIMTLTIRLGFRFCKLEPPKLRFIFTIAFLQILLGILTIYVVERIKYEPFLIIGTSLGVIILSDLLFLKMFLKNGWKQSLRIWATIVVMQLVLLPACSGVMLLGWFVFYFMNHPPQP
jgi:hypothetical protein